MNPDNQGCHGGFNIGQDFSGDSLAALESENEEVCGNRYHDFFRILADVTQDQIEGKLQFIRGIVASVDLASTTNGP